MKIEKDQYDCEKLTIENYDDFSMFVEALDQLKKKAVPIMNAYLELANRKPRYPIDADEISFEDGYVTANWEDYVCGSTDYYSESMPAEYLFDDDWAEDAKKKIEARRERERIQEEKQKAERKRRHEEAERKRYLELKEKFENE